MAFRAFSHRLPAAHHHHHHHHALARVRSTPSRWSAITTTTTTPLPPSSSRPFSAEAVSHPANLVQVYISRSTDPYLNLSIEHFLLQRSHPDSVVLLLYTNRPCVVIGRNQNPWVEANLGLINQRGVLRRLRAGSSEPPATAAGDADADAGRDGSDANNNNNNNNNNRPPPLTFTAADPDGNDDVVLVRRRSGGGTVFHDAGNVNYSVICPPAAFSRDKHAEMVARALRRLLAKTNTTTATTATTVRVNERHDIVLDVPADEGGEGDGNGAGSGGSGGSGGGSNGGVVQTFKISGSAYKLTRTRSLHHGTCLLSSPHLRAMGDLLRSPAAPYILARGVESVRSRVRNVGVGDGVVVSNAAFEAAVVSEFRALYDNNNDNNDDEDDSGGGSGEGKAQILDATDANHIPEVWAGIAELMSRDWVYGQTPQFVFASRPTADDPRPRPDPPADLPLPPSGLRMTVRHGQITEVAVASSGVGSGDAGGSGGGDGGDGGKLADSLKGAYLHRIDDWRTRVGAGNEAVGRWLNGLFGVGG